MTYISYETLTQLIFAHDNQCLGLRFALRTLLKMSSMLESGQRLPVVDLELYII